MMTDINVQPHGKGTAYTVLSQEQVDSIRGESGRGRLNIILRFEAHAPDVLKALKQNSKIKAVWDRLAPSHKRQHLKHIEGAQKSETRIRRISKLVSSLGKAEK